MGFDPASLLAEATAVFGSGSAATGATAAATAATGTAAAAGAAATAGAAAGTAATGAAVGAGAAAAGLSSSTLLSLGASAGATLLASALGPKPPKPGQAPQQPNLFGGKGGGATALLPSQVGDAGGTFLTGNNRAPQIDGGKKTLLGQ